MNKIVSHDSRDSKRGDFFQPLVGIMYALSKSVLCDFKKLTIEHHGDVSFDSLCQIETKHHKLQQSLGDTSEDFWKTLYNWVKQDLNFDKLVLHTTSHFPKKGKSFLKKWNNSSIDERVDLLKKIEFGYNLRQIKTYFISERTIEILENKGIKKELVNKIGKQKLNKRKFEKLLMVLKVSDSDSLILLSDCKDTSHSKYKNWNYSRYINSCSLEKLQEISSKVTLDTNQEKDFELVKKISKLPIFRGVCKSDKDFIFLIQERIAGAIASKVVGEEKWEVSNQQFYTIINESKSVFFNENYKPIFDIYAIKEPSKEAIIQYTKKKFVDELDRILCKPEELKEAIVDYWKTNTLLGEELESNPMFVDEEYLPYKETIIHPQLINKKRTFYKVEDKSENLKKSLRFYREARGLNYGDYKSIKSFPYFTHGTLHNIIEDDAKEFNWIIDD